MDNVVKFPGVTYGKINPELVVGHLNEVVDSVESIMTIGFLKDGSFFLSTSEGEIKENLWILENAKMNFREHMLLDLDD